MNACTSAARAALPLLAVLVLSACSMTQHSTGLTEDGALTPCPDAPRCVSSQAGDPDKKVEAFVPRTGVDNLWQRMAEVVSNMKRTTVVKRTENYLHAEVVSPWHFYTDDLELLRAPGADVIHVRSSGRVGYYDFNVNRDRVEKLRGKLMEAGLVAGHEDGSPE